MVLICTRFYILLLKIYIFFGVEKKRENFNLVQIILAAWPSGKAGDCKSFFPSSNPGAASTGDLKSPVIKL